MVLPPFNLAATGSRSVGTPVPGGLGLLTFLHAVYVSPGYDSIKTLPVRRQTQSGRCWHLGQKLYTVTRLGLPGHPFSILYRSVEKVETL